MIGITDISTCLQTRSAVYLNDLFVPFSTNTSITSLRQTVFKDKTFEMQCCFDVSTYLIKSEITWSENTKHNLCTSLK